MVNNEITMQLTDVRAMLENSEIFAEIVPHHWEALSNFCQLSYLPSGSELVKVGDQSDNLYVVLSGKVAAVLADQNGVLQQLYEFKPGMLAGEFAVLNGGRRTFSLKTIENAQILMFNWRSIRQSIFAREFVSILEGILQPLLGHVTADIFNYRVKHDINAATLLRQHSVFAEITSDNYRFLLPEIKYEYVAEQEVLLAEHEEQEDFHVLFAGTCSVYHERETNLGVEMVQVGELGPDNFFGAASLTGLKTIQNDYMLLAKTPCLQLILDCKQLLTNAKWQSLRTQLLSAIAQLSTNRWNKLVYQDLGTVYQQNAYDKQCMHFTAFTLRLLLVFAVISLVFSFLHKFTLQDSVHGNSEPWFRACFLALMLPLTVNELHQSGLSLRFFGWQTTGMVRAVCEAVFMAIAMCLGATMIKYCYIILSGNPLHIGLFQPDIVISHGLPEFSYYAIFLAYGLFAFIVEFIVRGTLQHALVITFADSGKLGVVWAIIAANVIAGVFHLGLYSSWHIAYFMAGLVYGYVFYRQNNIVSVSVLHWIVGVYLMFYLGIEHHPIF